MQIARKVAVITGASSGIGRALAVELGLRGASIIAAARSAAKLRETSLLLSAHRIDHRIVIADIANKSAIENLITSAIDAYSRVDIFINNAGVGLFDSISTGVEADAMSLFATNFWGPVRAMQLIAPHLQDGFLVNISSAASKYAPLQQGMYAASKAALERVTEAMGSEEYNRFRTLVVIPDRTATPFMNNVLGEASKAKLGLSLKFASSETVANRIARAIEEDQSVCYTTVKSRIYNLLSALAPSLVARIIRKAAQ